MPGRVTKLPGLFVVIDGPHGVGKTTVSKRVVKGLEVKGIQAVYDKEPFSEELKPIIASLASGGRSNAYPLAYLISVDRFLHTQEIKERKANGAVVVCDRYMVSSRVYQRIDGVPTRLILRLNQQALEPDAQFLIVAPLAVRKSRLTYRIRENPNHRFYTSKALEKEQELYLQIGKADKKTIILDGTQPLETIVAGIIDTVLKKLSIIRRN